MTIPQSSGSVPNNNYNYNNDVPVVQVQQIPTAKREAIDERHRQNHESIWETRQTIQGKNCDYKHPLKCVFFR